MKGCSQPFFTTGFEIAALLQILFNVKLTYSANLCGVFLVKNTSGLRQVIVRRFHILAYIITISACNFNLLAYNFDLRQLKTNINNVFHVSLTAINHESLYRISMEDIYAIRGYMQSE